MFFAHSGFIQSTSPSSTIALITLRTSYRAARCRRHDLVQLLDAPLDRIGRRIDGRLFAIVLREERQVAAHGRQTLLVVGDFEIGDTAHLRVHGRATHLFFGDVLADRRLHEVAAAERHRRRAFHHRHEVGERGNVRGTGRAVAEHGRDHRHHTAHRDLFAEQRARAREGRTARRLNARAGTVEQPDKRDALAHGVGAHPRDLVFADRAHRPGHHREVVCRDCDRAAVDLADTGDRAVGGEVTIAEARVHVVGEQAVLDPRARVEQQLEPFAHRELAERMLPFDELFAAHLERACFARGEIADERPPVVPFVSHVPVHFGSRFSANAATPSAASFVWLVIVSIVCRYESAASASSSSTL